MRVANELHQRTVLARGAIRSFPKLAPLGSILLISALVLGGTGAAPEATPSSDKATMPVTRITPVDPAKAAALIGKGGVIVLDIRTPNEFSNGHLRGATNIDFTARDFADRVAGLDRSQTYLLYCATGRRSARSLALFESLKFKSILHLEHGIKAWLSSGQPVDD